MLASGALHQMTMVKIVELKANQLEEQHKQHRKEEEERPFKTNLAFKLVGMIMNTIPKSRSSISAPWIQDKPYSGGGLCHGSAIGSDSSPEF